MCAEFLIGLIRNGLQHYKTDKYFNYCKKMANYVFEIE